MSSNQPTDPAFKVNHDLVQNIFRNFFRDDSLLITGETAAKDIDGWDSLAHMTLIVTIEKAFNIKFKLAELHDVSNVGDILTLINTKTKK